MKKQIFHALSDKSCCTELGVIVILEIKIMSLPILFSLAVILLPMIIRKYSQRQNKKPSASTDSSDAYTAMTAHLRAVPATAPAAASSKAHADRTLYSRVLANRPMCTINAQVFYLSTGTSMAHGGGPVVQIFRDTWMGAAGVGRQESDGTRKINKRANDALMLNVVTEQSKFDNI